MESTSPFLLFMLGPLQGKRVELSEETIVLGRERSNTVYIGDLLLSRRHCSIEKNGYSYVLRDLQSRNGVLVNGTRVQDHTLNHSDRVEIGASTFLFMAREDTTLPDFSVVDESLQAGSTVALRIEDSVYLKETPSSLTTKSAKLLIRFSQTLNGATDLLHFCEKLLVLLSEIVPYQRASILQADAKEIVLSRSVNPRQVEKFSQTLCQKVLSEKVAVLATKFSIPESISGSQVEAVLCVPFLWLGEVLFLLYMDTSDGLGFNDDHLQIAAAVTTLTSPVLANLRQVEMLERQNEELQERLLAKGPIIGDSPAIQKVLQLISRLSQVDSTILIYGESGTGKELAAKAIHGSSERRNGPMIAINCAAIPETLLESELFGYEKGAFTGAVNQKKGKIESANGGTLFLDEIGELAPTLQAKLLRVLQSREFERVGGTRPVTVDIRIIAATNQNLQTLIEQSKFRKDLYYRLNVVTLTMPALREISEDILILAQHFVAQFQRKIGRKIQGFSPAVKDCLLHYDWPGNVRELQNALERAVALGTSEWIQLEDLPETMLERRSISVDQEHLPYQDALLQLKRNLVLKAFDGTRGNYGEAAARLGVNLNHLYRLVKNLNLKDQI